MCVCVCVCVCVEIMCVCVQHNTVVRYSQHRENGAWSEVHTYLFIYRLSKSLGLVLNILTRNVLTRVDLSTTDVPCHSQKISHIVGI